MKSIYTYVAGCLCGVIVAIAANAASSESLADADIYECKCYADPISSTTIFGGVECQHGHEQDPDYRLWVLATNPNTPAWSDAMCSETGGGALTPVPLTYWNSLPLIIQNTLRNQGINPDDLDGKVSCLTCGINNTAGDNGRDCEGVMDVLNPHCEKDKTGNCNVADDGTGTIRIDYLAKLKDGETACTYPFVDGAGFGQLEVAYCGGFIGTGAGFIGANCISQACEKDPQSAGSPISGPKKKCVNPE